MLIRLRCQNIDQVRAGCSHDQRVTVVGSHLVDTSVLDHLHDFGGTANGTRGQTRTQRLCHGYHVRLHTVQGGGTTGGNTESRLHLVKNEDDSVALRDVTHRLQVTGLWEDNAQVHHCRLHDHAGGLATLRV